MLRRAKFPVLAVVALLAACSSHETSTGGGAGSPSSAPGTNGGAPITGGGSPNGAGGRGGAAPVGPTAGASSSTGGRAALGGASGDGGSAGSASSTAGLTARGGDGGTAGRTPPSSGGAANAGRGASGSTGMGGGAGSGGASGASSGGMAGTGGSPSAVGARCPDTTWKLSWGDDFDGPAGSAVDGSKWTYDTGPNWYNGELEDYTSGTDNASLDGNGNLVIEARNEAREGRQYTSARLKTEGKKTFTYGRFEGRMKLPYGQGMWPAFWLLGGNNWPTTGEIDIMENLGREPSIVHGTMHGPGYSGSAGPTASYTLPGSAKFSDDFHVFAIEWETNAIRWYVDDTLYSTKTPADIGGNTWVFDHGFFFILNLAVGGDWPGDPDATTVFPQHLVIDYVRVCEK